MNGTCINDTAGRPGSRGLIYHSINYLRKTTCVTICISGYPRNPTGLAHSGTQTSVRSSGFIQSLRSSQLIDSWARKEGQLNLNVWLKATPQALSVNKTDILLICDYCHKFEESVVATLHILELDETWSLCEACADECKGSA